MKGRCFFLLFVAFLFGVVSLHAGEFALRVDDISGLDNPWPLVASLAFPEGELKDVQAIRIMSGGREVSCQVDVAALWRDGSIRWALAGFTSSPAGQYRVEYGPGMKRSMYPNPLKVTRHDGGGLTVETGAAVYRFDSDKLMPEEGWLVSGGRRTAVLEGSGSGAYLVDNSGRTGRISGAAAEVENTVLKEGPGRFVIKRSGWYVTDKGEKLARADAWFYFSAGTPHVKITHSLILTEDTNKIWIRDYGLEFRTPDAPGNVYLAEGQAGKESIRRVEAQGEEVYMLQDTYPHFAERESRAVVGKNGKPVSEFQVAGDWAHGDYGRYGITLVMPWLAERFPKEISFGPGKARAVLWSNRSGRELDFRSSTLAKEYWQSWAEKGLGSPGISKLSGVANNAQGAARTHDIWLLPRAGGYDPLHVSKTAIAAARSPLVLAEPQWLCKTEALGWPMHHRDTEKFSREEAFISETWERLMLPHKVFPMNGFINWGHGPYITYRNVNGTWFADFLSYGDMSVYNVRRHTWSLYARSGERRYYDSGHRFNRILGDFGIAHCDAPNKLKGGFTRLRPPVHRMPFYWGNMTQVYDMNSSSSDIGNWLMEYYLSGDEYCRDVLVKVGESFRKHWNVKEATDWRTALSFLTLRKLVNLYMMEWDEDFGRMARELAHALISIEKQTGVTPEYMTYGCAMYKDQRHVPTLYMYYRETGDELGKEAFLKILDHRYRFYRNPFPISYQSAAAFAYPIAYGMTGNVNYRRVIEQTVNDGFSLFSVPLEKELANMPEDPYLWKTLPRLGVPNHTHSFLGLPTAMKFFTEKGIAGNPFPLLVKSMKDTPSRAVFLHQGDRDTVINLFCYTPARGNVKPELTPYPLSSKAVPLPGIRIEMEERIETMVPITYGKPASPNYQYHVKLAVPSSVPAGMYLLSLRGNEPFVILDSTSPKVALHCPEGFWTAFAEVEGDGWAVNGQGNASRLGDCQPFFFRVPEGLKELEIFLGRPVEIMTAGGKVMLEADTKSTGRISVPVSGNHGIWMIAPSSRDPMVFVRLLNVNPLVSYGSASRLPEKALEEAVVADAESLPLSGMEFVPGISGKALRLYGEQFIKFPSGKEERQGGYTFFPGKQGTVEFWFKPDWSSRYIVLGSGDSYRVLSFLQGPHIHAGYRYGSRASQKLIYSDLILELLGTFPGAEPLRPFLNAKSLIGREDNHIFKVGEWVHVAYTWSFDEKEKKWEFVTFAGGRRLDDYRSPERVRFLRVPGQSKVSSWQAKSDTFNISKEDREVVLGPFKGTMDSLRISDIVRYRQDFTQPETVFEKDINTRALFLFDGTLKGSSALSAEPVEAVH